MEKEILHLAKEWGVSRNRVHELAKHLTEALKNSNYFSDNEVFNELLKNAIVIDSCHSENGGRKGAPSVEQTIDKTLQDSFNDFGDTYIDNIER